jgi:hypothetical protein
MFEHTSRYYAIPVATIVGPDGREIAYVRRRFLPPADDLPMLAEVEVQQGDRIDLVAHRTLGDPLAFWRVYDANPVADPRELTEQAGRRLRIPLPQQ